MAAGRDVQIVREGSVATLVLTGEIDVGAAAEVMFSADQLLADKPQTVVVDLSGTTFLDSAGVGALVGLNNAAAAAGLDAVQLRAGPANVMRVLEIVGLVDSFEVI